MITRLISFYKSSIAGCDDTMSELWKNLTHVIQKKLEDALVSENPEVVEATLNKLIESGSTTGIEGYSVVKDTTQYNELLKRLAQRMGLISLQNPEQPSPSENWNLKNGDEITSKIESSLGMPLSVPGCFDQSPSGGIPTRFTFYCSAAFTVRSWGMNPDRVLEIGAGLGNLGLISHRWNAKSFTVIDLPSVAVMSAYFVSTVCGEEKVWLWGEPDRDNAFGMFYPSTHFDGVRNHKYDLVFNSDSLPEMTTPIQDTYLNLISDCLSPYGIFLSINHESDLGGQNPVGLAVKRNGRLKLKARYPFQMRDGYIEEIYQL